MKTLTLITLLFLISCNTTSHNYKQGDILFPDYAISDTLLVIRDFSIPEYVATDMAINEAVMPYTILYSINVEHSLFLYYYSIGYTEKAAKLLSQVESNSIPPNEEYEAIKND